MSKSFFSFIAMLLLGAGLLVSCNKGGQAAPAAGQGGESYRFIMMIYSSAGNPFWTKVMNGASETAKAYGCKVDIQYADNDPVKGNNIIETAVANKVDGIGIAMNVDDAYDGVVKKARDAGIPVVAFNVDDSQGAAGNARMAYVGQLLEEAGYKITKELIKRGGLKAGDFVPCPVEQPEATYAIQRYRGVKKAFDEVGIRSEVVNTGAVSLQETLDRLTQYLLGHKEAKAVMAMGGMPMEMTPKACANVGANIPNAGFDLTQQIALNIKDGKTLCVIDQQPYYQGAFTVMQLVLNKKYGLLPCDINTGGAIIDKTNVEKVVNLANSVR